MPLSKVEIGLIDLPTERYKRNTVRGKLDLVGKCFGLRSFHSLSVIIYITYTLCLFFISLSTDLILLSISFDVVSMGGTTGLFVGASILSFVEIIYYFTIRPYSNVVTRNNLPQSQPSK